MKTINLFAVTALVAMSMVFASCSKDEVETPFYSAPSGTSHELSSFEQEGLLVLLEKEKMHRDLYVWMNSQFASAIFINLAERDGHYMDLLSLKVDKYGLENPIADKSDGEFENAYVQDQYNEIVQTSAGDLEAMLNEAKSMESALITEIEEQRSTLAGNADIVKLYTEMIKESQAQLDVLVNEAKGLIHIYAPKPTVEEM